MKVLQEGIGAIKDVLLKSNQETFDTNLEQLYLGYQLMFVGILITTIIGFGGMFKRTIFSFASSEE